MLGFSALSEAPLSALPSTSGATDATVTPGVGSLTLTGYAPTVTAQKNITVTPGAGSLTLTGFAPTVSATQSKTVLPGTGTLTITGYAPSVTVPTSVTVTPGAGALTITGYAPSVVAGPDVSTFDTHDGFPRERSTHDWDAQENRARDERRKTREAIEAAMRSALGLAAPAPDDEPEPPSLPPKPLNRTQVKRIAAMLVDTTPAAAEFSLRDLEAQVRLVEADLRKREADRIALEREIEEEDEMILLWAA